MNHKLNLAFRQFAKDCPEHFSKDVLIHAHLRSSVTQIQSNPEKSTRTSKIINKF